MFHLADFHITELLLQARMCYTLTFNAVFMCFKTFYLVATHIFLYFSILTISRLTKE